MGASIGREGEIRAKEQFFRAYSFVEEREDAHYSNVKIFERNPSASLADSSSSTKSARLYNRSRTLAIKESVFQDSETAIRELTQLKNLISQNESSYAERKTKNYVEIFECFMESEDRLCSSVQRLQIVLEYLQRDLQIEIKTKKLQNQRFTPQDLFTIALSTINALSHLQKAGIKHGHLRASQILISDNYEFKLVHPSIVKPTPSFIALIAANQGGEPFDSSGIYLSPALTKAVAHGQYTPQHNEYKSDVFTLGMILLECCLLLPVDGAYDYQSGEIRDSVLQMHFQTVKSVYGLQVYDVLSSMLKVSEQERPDFIQLATQLNVSAQMDQIYAYQQLQIEQQSGHQQQQQQQQQYQQHIRAPNPSAHQSQYSAHSSTSVAQGVSLYGAIPTEENENLYTHSNSTPLPRHNNQQLVAPVPSSSGTYKQATSSSSNVPPPNNIQSIQMRSSANIAAALISSSSEPQETYSHLNGSRPFEQAQQYTQFQVNPQSIQQSRSFHGQQNTPQQFMQSQQPQSFNNSNANTQQLRQSNSQFPQQYIQQPISAPVPQPPNYQQYQMQHQPQQQNYQHSQQLNPQIYSNQTQQPQQFIGSHPTVIQPQQQQQQMQQQQQFDQPQQQNYGKTFPPRAPQHFSNPSYSASMNNGGQYPPVLENLQSQPVLHDIRHSQTASFSQQPFAQFGQQYQQPVEEQQQIQSQLPEDYQIPDSVKQIINEFKDKQIQNDIQYQEKERANHSSLKYSVVPRDINGSKSGFQQRPNSSSIAQQLIGGFPNGEGTLNPHSQGLQYSQVNPNNSIYSFSSPKGDLNMSKYDEIAELKRKQQQLQAQLEEQEYRQQQQQQQAQSLTQQSQHQYQEQMLASTGNELEQIHETYDDQSHYVGEKLDGLRHGQGKFFYADGGYYMGEWREGRMEGLGTLYYPSGNLAYHGNWRNDQFNGQGTVYNENPMDIAGEFDFTNLDNLGEYWIKYEGDFLDDNKEGLGAIYLSNGDRFVGSFSGDFVHGRGQFFRGTSPPVSGIWECNHLVQYV